MTRNEVMTSLESPMPEVAVKEIIKEGIAGLELVVSLHINSLKGVVTKPLTHNTVLL